MKKEMSDLKIIQNWVSCFEEALARKDVPALSRLFESDCYWRDLVAFTWNIVVFEGLTRLQECFRRV